MAVGINMSRPHREFQNRTPLEFGSHHVEKDIPEEVKTVRKIGPTTGLT